MAQGTVTVPDYVTRLSHGLRQALAGGDVAFEQVRVDRFRFVVVWDGFEDQGHPERQERVWDIAEAVVEKADLFKVSMIVTLAPSELPDE